MADSVIMRSREGKLFEVHPDEVAQLERDRGYVPADDGEVAERTDEREQYARFGSTAQQAQGLADTFVRNATLGAVQGIDASEPEEDTRARAAVVGEESPILNTAAAVAPAVGAGLATGGAGLGVAGTAAAEALVGGYGGVGGAADEAFQHDQELSAEAAWNSFGSGALLGAAGSLAISGAGKALGAARNRFVEASGKVARKAEAEALTGAGVLRPVEGLAEAIDDPVKAAKLRAAAKKARPEAQQQLADELRKLDEADQAARQFVPDQPDMAAPVETADDVARIGRQRSATREAIGSAREQLEAIAEPEVRGIMARSMENLDRAESSGQIHSVAKAYRAALDEALDASSNPATARVLAKQAERARALEQNAELFGEPAGSAANTARSLADLGEARQALLEKLDGADFLGSVGTQAGAEAETALDTYLERLGGLLRDSDSPSAREGLAAIGRVQKLREGPIRAVAGGNQADAMREFSGAPKGATGAKGIMADILGEVAETALEAIVPGVGLARKAWKYRKHVARLAGDARTGAGVAADRLLGTASTTVGRGSRALARGVVPLGARAGYFTDLGGDPAQQYERVRDSVERLVREPERLTDMLAEDMGDIPREAPDLLGMVASKAARAVDFLRAKLPPSFEYSLLYPDGPPPSRTDILQLSLYWRGATQGRQVLEAIGDGSAMPEEVEAFRAVNPTWFAELQDQIQERIVTKNRSGQVVPGYRIAQLESLLDLPGGLDPAFSDGVAAVAHGEMAAQQQAEQSPSYVPAPKAGERTKSASLERI